MAAVSLRLPEDIGNRLQRLADETGRSKTYYMIEAIKEHLSELEDAYLPESRLSDIKSGKVKPVPYEEVRHSLGLDN